MTPRRFLHVANGTSTTGTIVSAGIPGHTSIWADPLYEGPVPGNVNDDELRETRAAYLNGELELDSIEPVNDMRLWRSTIEDRDAYDELVLWYEHDLFDQLNLIQLLDWIDRRGLRAMPVSLVSIGSFPGRSSFKGLGELTPRELSPLFDARQPVTGEQFTLARAAWQAFRAATPEALDQLRRRDDALALPFLAPALERFLQEYPWTSDGLSRTERQLLRQASGDGASLAAAFPRMHDGETAYYVTDLSLASMADRLSRTSPPLLTLAPANGGGPLRRHVGLTATGRSVLEGEQDRVAACGIDRWLGGVHLTSAGSQWRWDEERRTIVRA
jgi:hypothetical protein